MRLRLASLLAITTLSACTDSFEGQGEWIYQPSDRFPSLFYGFYDPEQSMFVGLCDLPDRPDFSLIGGPRNRSDLAYDVDVDGHRWHVAAIMTADGAELDLSEPEILEAIAGARDHITITQGRWRRSFPASPLLARFLTDCRAAQNRRLQERTSG